MMTRSPGETRCAAAPFTQMTPAVRRPLDRVGLEAVAVGDVPHAHRLVRQQVGRVHQAPVDGDRALVVDVCLGHGGAVDLRPHHLACHRSIPPGTRMSIVDQPDSAHPDGHREQRRPMTTSTTSSASPDRGARRTRDAPAARPRSPSAPGSTITPGAVSPAITAAAAAASARGTQRAASRSSPSSRLATRQRQAVGLAHRRHAHDLDAEVEVGGHATDHRELLPVLLAEDGRDRAGRRGRASSPRW